MIRESRKSIRIPVVKVSQPIGDFYVGMMASADLVAIADFDVRRIIVGEGIESYLGIQREVSPPRIKEISQYVEGLDATFPTAVVLAVEERCALLEMACAQSESHYWLTLSNYFDDDDDSNSVLFRQIAHVIDGQHRIEGLRNYKKKDFEINVSIFIAADLPDQASIFSTVNLAQTKVNKSLVYDLFDLAKSKSPEKLAHNVVVALDRTEGSPFYERIKRLGTTTVGRDSEMLAQATVVAPILKYISGAQLQIIKDRQAGLRGSRFDDLSDQVADRLVFRPFLIQDRDVDLAELIWNYFEAISEKWPDAWNGLVENGMLNRTNGYNALMRLMRPAYISLTAPGKMVTKSQFSHIFANVSLPSRHFTTRNYLPGTSGSTALFNDLANATGLAERN